MERWHATCPGCDDAALRAEDLRLLTPADPTRAVRAVFRCGTCGHHGSLVVAPEVARGLAGAGAPVSHGHPSLGARPERSLALITGGAERAGRNTA